jgi:hypothetical protein
VHGQSTKVQGRLAIIRERTSHRQTVASDAGSSCVLTWGDLSLNLAHTFDILLEFGLGVSIGLNDRLGSFFEIVELTQLVGNVRQDLLHRQADGALGIRNDRQDWHRQGVLDLAQQVGQVVLARTVETASQQDFTRECVAQNPEHVLSFERLQTIKGEDDMALLLEELFEAGRLREMQREQFFVALQEVGDGARSNGDVQVLEGFVDLGDGAMLTVAQRANVGNHIQTEFAMRQSPSALFFGTNGQMVARTGRVGAAQDGQGQAGDIVEGGDGALGLVEVPQATTAP